MKFSLADDPAPLAEIGAADRIDTTTRVQHPTWNVFEGAEYLETPGRLMGHETVEKRKAVEAECAKREPENPSLKDHYLDAPQAPEPWYPGWPAPAD